MVLSCVSVEGERVFEKDGVFIYRRRNGDHVAYVSILDRFVESKPAADLEGALAFADLIIREGKEMKYASQG